MYQYDQYDEALVRERVEQFRDQTRRFLAGELDEEEFKALRLRNGLYLQRHAPMLRVSIPYGLLSSQQLRMLAHIARHYDRSYGHFSTRQNIQYNWPRLEEVPDILAELATVGMHAIQTSGNCIRNITTDHLAGIAPDEVADPRPYCEIIRQWATLHPEFSFLPRKFKIAVTGSPHDRAAIQVHDIGLELIRNPHGEIGFRVLVGGGLGRTPCIGVFIREFLEARHLLSYLEAILRVYNLHGRRDNIYKARIKILVRQLGGEAFARQVETEWEALRDGTLTLEEEEIQRFQHHFQEPRYPGPASPSFPTESATPGSEEQQSAEKQSAEKQSASKHEQQEAARQSRHGQQALYSAWLKNNVVAHKAPGYRAVYISLKASGQAPGDATAQQMETVAELAERYSAGEIRVTHTQNLLLGHVHRNDLDALWEGLEKQQLTTPNIGLVSDIICCPGLDFCSLANAASISVANDIQKHFEQMDYQHDLGELRINISGCVNACGHHHVGHIGILGVEKSGEEFYQLTLGGSSRKDASLGNRLGPAIAKNQVTEAIEHILALYLELRDPEESFLDTYRRVGIAPFKKRVYENPQAPGNH